MTNYADLDKARVLADSQPPVIRLTMHGLIDKVLDARNSLTLFDRVEGFNNMIGVDVDQVQPLDEAQRKWLGNALDEELGEYLIESDLDQLRETTHVDGPLNTVVHTTDALIDLCIFAIGGMVRMGLNGKQIEKCFHAVMDANMKKKAGPAGKDRDVEGVQDAFKPDGWTPPEETIRTILKGKV